MSSAPGVTASDWLARYPPPRSLTLDQEALRIYELAYYIGAQVEKEADPYISFTSVAAALLIGEDDTSRWFAKMAQTLGPLRNLVFDTKNITQGVLDQAQAQHGPPSSGLLHLSADQQLLTSSSRAVLESAENWAQRVGGTDIGVRHLVASYVLNPPAYHRDQLKKWGVNEAGWRAAFFDRVRSVTWEQWIDTAQRAVPGTSRVSFEQKEVKGRTLAWPGDELAGGVLTQAAQLHQLTGQTGLSYVTLFCALVQAADANVATREKVEPIWRAVKANQARYDEAFGRNFSAQPQGPVTPFNDLDVMPRVLNTLETARELAIAARTTLATSDAEMKVSPLHLAGALVSPRVDATEELAAFGLDVPQVRKALMAHATGKGESVEVWSEVLGEEEMLLAGRPVDLNSDEPEAVVRLDESWTSDPLAIRPDVEAFASLLASRSLEPPLSIGLFGPWGSGKTTFLKRLRRAVQRHADEARNAGGTGNPYVPNVVHVEFNAWHFSEDALVSSLVDATIRAIREHVKGVPDLGPTGWLEEKLASLESRRRQLDAATELKAIAEKAVARAQDNLTVREQEAARCTASVRSALSAVWAATRNAIKNDTEVKDSGVLDALGGIVRDAGELRQRIEQLRARPGRMLADLGWPLSIVFALLVLALPPLAGTIVRSFTDTVDFRAVASVASTVLAVIGVWAKVASQAVSRADRAMTRVVAEYDQRIATDPSVVGAQALLRKAQADAATAASALEAARTDFARAQAEVANASLSAQTLQLVTTRIEDRSYAKELTTLSLARADLEMLSRILREQRTAPNGDTGQLRAVDRVILYIDDLDRCKPEDVVRVLQLVHMLLAFELFVVVVAVDARWVEQALRQSYPWLTRGKGMSVPNKETADECVTAGTVAVEPFEHVTPEDYLEKIFQISFWLEPMTAGRAASYLTSLVRPVRPTTATTLPLGGGQGSAGKVDISSVELDYLRALAAYVGSSPRRVKRLVNAYRLIKARLSDSQLNTFVSRPDHENGGVKAGPYQVVIGLLVIGTGMQSAASAILGALGNWDPRARYVDLIANFRKRNDPEWTAAAQVIETIMRTQAAQDVADLRGWARKVRRYLLQGTDAEAGAPAPAPEPSLN